ncbi:hypothetical protein CVT24_002418 [Panaeolus cyanescens]|uniref:Uncharacterized protein n=1 Tax=Panaeolus cyanescens TaxID=181874 RepID=A0A409WZW6_9AGAR|nr:hypothetical protein CVT24_002418 [Panaeolus cyanescens]
MLIVTVRQAHNGEQSGDLTKVTPRLKWRIRQEPPRITNRIQFFIDDPSPLPTITARIPFDRIALLERRKALTATSSFEGAAVVKLSSSTNASPDAGQMTSSDAGTTAAAKRPRPSRKPADSGSSGSTISQAGEPQASSSHQPLIPKPAGEPGRPGSGGYNIKAVLEKLGTQSRIDEFTACTKSRATLYLDDSLSYKNQDKVAINRVVSDVRQKFPELAMFADDWPVHDILKGHCKYRSSRVRQASSRPQRKKRRVIADQSNSDDDSDELDSEVESEEE